MKKKKKKNTTKKLLLLTTTAALMTPALVTLNTVDVEAADVYTYERYSTIKSEPATYGYAANVYLPKGTKDVKVSTAATNYINEIKRYYKGDNFTFELYKPKYTMYSYESKRPTSEPKPFTYSGTVTGNENLSEFRVVYMYDEVNNAILGLKMHEGSDGIYYYRAMYYNNEWQYEKNSLLGTVNAVDGTYPDDGYKDGYWYKKTKKNSAPTGSISTQTVLNTSSIYLDLNSYFSDADKDTLTYTASSANSTIASASAVGSGLTLRGLKKGSTTITVTARDASGSNTTITRTFTLNVTNNAPTMNYLYGETVNRGTSKTVSIVASDADGDTLTLTGSSSNTSVATISVNNSAKTITVNAIKPGSSTITATISDGTTTTSRTFVVTVPNNTPTLNNTFSDVYLKAGESSNPISLSGTDADGDSLTYSVTSNSTSIATASVSGNQLTVRGVKRGSATMTVRVTDAHGAYSTKTFTTYVTNSEPTNKTTIPAQMIDGKGKTTTVNLASYFQDADGDALTYTATSNVTSKVTTSVSGSTLTLNGVEKGLSTITVTATDSSGTSTSQTFTTTVGNTAPQDKNVIPVQLIEGKNKTKTIDLSSYFTDIDGDALTYTVNSSATDKVTSTVNGDVLTLTSVNKGNATITVTAMDSSGAVKSQTFITTVEIVAPVNKDVIPAQIIAGAGKSKELTLSNYFEDENGDNLTYTVTSNLPSKVTASVTGDKLTLTGQVKGMSTITVTATNSTGESTTQTFTTTVNNTSPTLTTNFNKLNLRPGDISSPIILNGKDPDNDDLSYIVSSSNDEIAKVTLVDNQLIVEGLIEGSANIMVKVIDGDLDYGQTISMKVFTVDVAYPAPVAPQEPIDVDNTGGLTNGTVNLGDIFDDENPADLIFKPNVVVNEPEADIFIQNQMLMIENPKKVGKIEVEVEATNVFGKTAIAVLNMSIDETDLNGQIKEGKATLKLTQGEFTLKTADVNDFGQVKLTAAKQTVTSNFAQEFGVVDARGTQEGWNVTVSATPFTVETFDDFVGVPHQLPAGSLALKDVTAIERINHINTTDGLPTSAMTGLSAIDTNNALNVLNANVGEGLGEFKFSFAPDALALTVDAVTAKIDTVNYPDQNTPYASTVTWDLISGPQM